MCIIHTHRYTYIIDRWIHLFIFQCVGFHPFYDGRWLVPLHVSTDPPTLQVFDVTSEEPLPCSTQWPLQFDQLKAIASWKAREKETNSCYSFQLSASLMNSTLSVFSVSICSFYMSFSMFRDWNWCPVRLNEHNECKSSGRFEDSFQEKEYIYIWYDIYILYIYLFTIIQPFSLKIGDCLFEDSESLFRRCHGSKPFDYVALVPAVWLEVDTCLPKIK